MSGIAFYLLLYDKCALFVAQTMNVLKNIARLTVSLFRSWCHLVLLLFALLGSPVASCREQ